MKLDEMLNLEFETSQIYDPFYRPVFSSKTEIIGPDLDSIRTRYRLSATTGVNFVASAATAPAARKIAKGALMRKLYFDIYMDANEIANAINNQDHQTSEKLIHKLIKKLSGGD